MGRAKLAAIGGLGVAAVSGLAWAIKHFLRDRGYDDLDSKIKLSNKHSDCNCLHDISCLVVVCTCSPCKKKNNLLAIYICEGTPIKYLCLVFGVAGVVSFSSRLVAGMRAFEGKEREPLFDDPLAELLAGRRGMQAAENTMKVSQYSASALCRCSVPAS